LILLEITQPAQSNKETNRIMFFISHHPII